MGIVRHNQDDMIEQWGGDEEDNSWAFAHDGDADENDEDDISVSSISPAVKWSKWMILLVLAVGLGGGTSFLVLGASFKWA